MMEDLPLLQTCSNVMAKAHVAAYGTHRQAASTNSETSSYVSFGVSEDCETIDSISLYSTRYERKRKKGTIYNIVEALAQMFYVFVISPEDIDCVANVIDEATQELAVELTVDTMENSFGTGGFEEYSL
jgi:hypothetical protein